uniref:Transmembrane 9 superfamily member n=1 Tax=Hanusia phi TaxID=3032 RepID=A0A7S0EMU6_9CRYP|mmetsp:Transcript_26635/g.60791  ORF Transcript_26635/g.60791 Transcript_26635/m.60791 type:complete len:663 (+) Transcript_26635:21-2009(+)
MSGISRSMRQGMLFLVVSCILVNSAIAFYLPGVAPTDYDLGDTMKVKVEALTSVKTQLPYEYYVLPFCHKGVNLKVQDALNLGEVLRGSRIYETPYNFKMGSDQTCKILCRSVYDAQEQKAFALMIEEDYRVNLLLDNLPVAMALFSENEDKTTTKMYEVGYPIGHVQEDDGKGGKLKTPQIYLFNHLRFTVLYNDYHGSSKRRVVGFEVEPLSIKHTYDNLVDWDECFNQVSEHRCKLNTCTSTQPVTVNNEPLAINTESKKPLEVIWTYDVIFKPSPIRWSTRWDTYLNAADDAQVHWFSILNSFMIVLFLSGIVAMIMINTIKRDFQRYERNDLLEDGQEETGWKLVHGDVFRAPVLAGWLSVLVGTGVQLAVSTVFLVVFACLGFLSPANRGALMQAMLFIFVFMGMFGGYTAARFFRMFKGNRWRSNALWTAMLFPGISFCIFFILNLAIWGQKSSGAVPFGTLFALLLMWLGISVPLVLIGAFFGYRKQPIENPVRTNQIPRQVPEQPFYVSTWCTIIVGGILPFGAVFVEVFYVLSSIWLHQFYYLFGFLLLVLGILFLTCCEVTVVLCYLQLCCEDYHWWWRSFLTSGSCSFYVFLYSIYYAYSKLQMARALAAFLYVCYMFIVGFAFFLITGALGFLASFVFIRTIYSAIKID